MPTRTVHHADSIAWMKEQTIVQASIITSIPDVSEVGTPFERWTAWFVDAAATVCAAAPKGLVILAQTDTRREGAWVDKSTMAVQGAQRAGAQLLCRKVICVRPPGAVSRGRATFSHLLVFGRTGLDARYPDLIPDVITEPGEPTWVRGMGGEVALHCVRFVQRYSPSTTTIVDPFCGEGITLAAANSIGLHAVGVELNRKRAQKARVLQLASS